MIGYVLLDKSEKVPNLQRDMLLVHRCRSVVKVLAEILGKLYEQGKIS